MIEIQPLKPADVPTKVRVEMEAFASHPRMPLMWPRGMTDDFYAYHEAGDLKDLQDPASRIFKAVHTESGQIVGSADWTLAVDAEALAKKQPTPADQPPPADWPLDGNWALRRWYRINLDRLLQRHLAGKPYILLNYLTVKPDRQGQGIGHKLISWGVKEADERGVAMCLESTPNGQALYKKNGFREVEVVDANMHDFGWTEPYDNDTAVRIFMIRDPR